MRVFRKTENINIYNPKLWVSSYFHIYGWWVLRLGKCNEYEKSYCESTKNTQLRILPRIQKLYKILVLCLILELDLINGWSVFYLTIVLFSLDNPSCMCLGHVEEALAELRQPPRPRPRSPPSRRMTPQMHPPKRRRSPPPRQLRNQNWRYKHSAFLHSCQIHVASLLGYIHDIGIFYLKFSM